VAAFWLLRLGSSLTSSYDHPCSGGLSFLLLPILGVVIFGRLDVFSKTSAVVLDNYRIRVVVMHAGAWGYMITGVGMPTRTLFLFILWWSLLYINTWVYCYLRVQTLV